MSDFETFCEELERVGGKYTADGVRRIMNPSYLTPEERWEKVKGEVVKSHEYKKVMYSVVSAATCKEWATVIGIAPEDRWICEIKEVLREDGYEVYDKLDGFLVCW
jgi:hypothetical protein